MANLASFDLNLLRVLDALLRERSTVRAGRRLGLSQPAVSAALGRLRAALGDELFFRRGQGLEATQYALSLEPPLREVLEGVERMLARPEPFRPERSEARFRISGADFFAEMLMPALAERLARCAPRMLVHLVDLMPDSYAGTLERYEVDLALIPREGTLPDWVRSERVFASPFVVVARRGHPRLVRAGVAPGAMVPLDLYCDLGHVLFSPEGRTGAMGDAALARLGRQRRVVMTLPVFSGVYRAVAGSDLVALLPVQLARRVAGGAGLEIYAAPMSLPVPEIEMIWHRREDARADLAWLRGQIADLLAPLDGMT
ncbi:LysR family transcriptional regulator [Alloyangia pacifica]|uniref:Transcriptional regulator, LysR family n=1 Tax=Alloyangia pacifica TaxID=311180 RepID=A0A1I6PYQ6_9RHOB|nr:LysR family transcriptional regulator [Alloyangia pacifica]SDG38826.1 transcriptional regulator, LysR family [Alloyangia pacifica]SFS45351.1 transcriptional regulator, LysR family [Alloyangia pacifica]